jgi:hypothetical protein
MRVRLRFIAGSQATDHLLTATTTALLAKSAIDVESDPTARDRRDRVRWRDGMRIATAIATEYVRYQLDESPNIQQHNRFPQHFFQPGRFAGPAKQHAGVRRTIDLSAAIAGRRGQSGVLLLRRLASQFSGSGDRDLVLPRAAEPIKARQSNGDRPQEGRHQ